MRALTTELLVIGGGATGAGVAFDAAVRGIDVVLVDRADLGEGTSGRFHGLLHSGGRYVVKDPGAARECAGENAILLHVAADAIEATGGLFVTTPFDDPQYADEFAAGCVATGVTCEEIDPAQALRAEPRLNPGISRAFRVPDASIDVWTTLRALARGVRERGGRVLTHHEVMAVHRDGDEVIGARLRDAHSGVESDVEAQVTVNATGAWAGQIAELAGISSVQIIAGRGIMIAMNHRLVNTVINRCQPPADGDILVPIRTVCVMGTTDVPVDDPDDTSITAAEVQEMLEGGEQLVPGFRQARALRVWAGVRPLWQEATDGVASTRDVTRAHALLDHAERDGVGRFVTITGGKLTTYRLMAQEAVDAACAVLGRDVACTTATTVLPGSAVGAHHHTGDRLRARERTLNDDQLICECELVTRARVYEAIADDPAADLDDIRRALRLGMGPCQGGFCMVRAAGLMHRARSDDGPAAANAALTAFLAERWKGVAPVLHGDQLRQAWLDEWIYQGVLDVAHLPA